MSNEDFFERILFNKKMSEDWLALLENAPDFNRFDLKPIAALLAAPCDVGTIIIRENQHSFTDKSTFDTLSTFHQTHRFFDYSVTRHCFKTIDGLPSYKVPFVNWHFVLCPLESTDDCSWVNPLDIYELQTIEKSTFVELINGLVLEIPMQKRSFLEQAERAIYSLCYLRREYSITLNYKGDPLNYIQLPVTPFMRTLRKRSFLQQWITDRGAFHQRYMMELSEKYKDIYL